MLEIILLIFGIIYAARRPRLKRLTVDKFPGVDAATFNEWKFFELRSVNAFIVTTWGAFAFQAICLSMLLTRNMRIETYFPMACVVFVLWLVGLTASAITGSKAKKLKKKMGIKWP